MKMIEIIVSILSASFTIYMQLASFAKLSDNDKLTFNFKNILIVIIGGVILYFNATINTSILRIIISFVTVFVSALYIYRYSISKTFMNVLVAYLIILFYEIIASLLMINISSMIEFDKSIIFKTIYSTIIVLLGYFTCCNKSIKNFLNKFVIKLENTKFDILISIVTLIFFLIIDSNNFRAVSFDVLIYNLAIVVCFSFIIVYAIYNYYKANKELEKTNILLSFIDKYEKIIDDDRILKHEILNNLLVLNSFEDKNTEEYNNILDDLINTYSKAKTKTKNLYKLPAGLKGLFYYKLYGLDEEGFNINIRIDKTLPKTFTKIKNKDYALLCRIVNIALDNAIEAAHQSKDKIINIEVYKENKECIVLIENSCCKKVDLNKIEEKGYSTKGKGRGLGLYIVNTLLKESDHIELEREYNNLIFTTKIIIK